MKRAGTKLTPENLTEALWLLVGSKVISYGSRWQYMNPGEFDEMAEAIRREVLEWEVER